METVARSRIAWRRVILWLSLVGLIASMAWGFFAYGGLQDRLSDLSRAPVPGSMAVEVSEAQSLTIFYEDPTADGTFMVQSSGANTLTAAPVQLDVTGPSGDVIVPARYERDLRFDHDGRVLIAMATFDAVETGTYVVDTSGDVPADVRVSVGEVSVFGLVANVVGVVGLFIASLLGMAVALVLIAARGGRSSSREVERQLVGV